MPVENGKLGLIEFVGVIKTMKPCQYRALREAVRAQHYGILSTRCRGGVMRTIELVGIVGRAPTPGEARCMLRECKRRGWSVVRERKSGARQGVRDVTRERV